MSRQLHILSAPGDDLALEVVARQLALGDEVRVVLRAGALAGPDPQGPEVFRMPPLAYDQLVRLLEWCDRVVSW